MSVYQKSSRSEILSNFGRKVASYLKNVENLLIKAAQPLKTEYTRELVFVCDFCGSNINRDI
jgi:hypothetical protein